MIEIKRWTDGKVLYTAENAQDVRQAVEEAVAKGVSLNGAELNDAKLNYAELNDAELNGAKLNYAELNDAKLNYAELNDAKLNYAELNYAELNGAKLNYAELNDAKLNGAKLNYAELNDAKLNDAKLNDAKLNDAIDSPHHPLWAFRQDYWSILDQAPREVAGLREAIVAGRINGSVYSDGECGCLNGTIAMVHGCDIERLHDELGIVKDARRPAEQWFISIVKGHKPLPLETTRWPSESVFRISHALAWLDEWIESRKAIAASLSGDQA